MRRVEVGDDLTLLDERPLVHTQQLRGESEERPDEHPSWITIHMSASARRVSSVAPPKTTCSRADAARTALSVNTRGTKIVGNSVGRSARAGARSK